MINTYSMFHQLRQAKFDDGGSILNSSQFSILPQKMKLALKLVKIDTKKSSRYLYLNPWNWLYIKVFKSDLIYASISI